MKTKPIHATYPCYLSMLVVAPCNIADGLTGEWTMLDEHPYFRYWGKASPSNEGMDLFHLLPYHSLDVSACGRALLDLPQFSLNSLAEELDWPPAIVEHLFVFFLA